MSYSCILIHGSPLSLKSKASGGVNTKPRKNILCCCPFFRQETSVVKASKLNNPPIVGSPLPPGPSFLDLMGLLQYAVRSFPYHHPMRDLAKAYGPLVHVKLGEVSTIVVSSAELAKEVLKTREFAFLNRPKSVGSKILSYDFTDVVVSPYNDYWKQMRNVSISKFLNPQNVRSMEHMRKDEASAVIESISSCKSQVNITDEISLFTNSMACRAVFGDVCLDRRDAIMDVKRGLSVGASFALADVFPSIKVFEFFSLNKYRMVKLRKKVDNIMDSIIDDHRKNLALMSEGDEELDNDNFLDVLLKFKQSEEDRFPITDDNIKSVVALLYRFDWKLPPGMTRDDIDMTEADGMAASRKNNLYLIATPYVPAA